MNARARPGSPSRAPWIREIGLAVPEHVRRQDDLLPFMVAAHGLNGPQERLLRALYKRSRIETRHSCLPDFGRPWREFTFFPADPRLSPPPPTSRRMEAYAAHAPALARAACADLFSRAPDVDPATIDHLFVVSCTGFLAPGLDVLLAQSLGLRADVGRTLIGFQGCQGGLTALRLAEYLCRANPSARALIVCVELCTLHFQNEPTEENLLANALFADGAAAVLVCGSDHLCPPQPRSAGPPPAGLRLERTATLLFPGTLDEMVWRVGDHGFELRLSDLLPRLLAANVPPQVARIFDLAPEDLRRTALWAVHPGGAAILEGLERALGLTRDAFRSSYEVLRRFGNMSSPTVFFVLREILDDPDRRGPGLCLAFGPGLTVEALQFCKVPFDAARPDRVSTRSAEREWIDDGRTEGEPLRLMLNELGVINRFLGGLSCSLSVLKSRLGRGAHRRFLDVGTGGGDLPRLLPRWSRRRGETFHIAACDISPSTCRWARDAAGMDGQAGGGAEGSNGGGDLSFVAADGFRLPFADRSFDVVHCALFLHHIPDGEIPRLLRELLRVARSGLLINDLHRHWLAERSIALLTRLFARSPEIRHDAPASVRRAFTRRELESIAAAASAGPAEIRWHWAFRYSVWIPAAPSHDGV